MQHACKDLKGIWHVMVKSFEVCKNSAHFETQKSTIWNLLKPASNVQEFTPLWDPKVYNLAFVEAYLKSARIHPTLRLKSVQSGICWSLSQMCKNSPHFETQKCTIWHLLKHTSKVQEFTPLWDSKVYNLAFVEACLKCARIHPTWKQEKVTCHFALVSVTCQWINQRQHQPIFILTGVCAEK